MRSLTFLLLILPNLLPAQDYVAPKDSTRSTPKEKWSFKDRTYFGGNLGLSFGTVTSVQVEPWMGVFLDERKKLSAGVGITYWYYRDSRFTPELESNSYGYRVFSRYRVLQPVYLHAEYSNQSFEIINRFDGSNDRQWVPFLLVGGGYVSSLGGRSSVFIQVLWDVLQDPNSPYGGQPFFSMGVGVSF